ncbi:restriction endonuclease subunit S [Aeromonas rivipollensis]
MAEQMIQHKEGEKVATQAIPTGYKQTEVGVIPKDWEVKSIGETMTLINGYGFKPYQWMREGLPIIRIQNLNDDDAPFNYYDGIVDSRFYINGGDLLFAWSGSKGSSFGARVWSGPRAILNQHIFKVVANNDFIESDFGYLILRSVQEDIEKKAHGFKSSFVHVKKGDLENTELPIPPKKEQTAIANVLLDSDVLIDALEQLIAKKQAIKTATMQQLLTGRTRLPQFAWRPDGAPKGYKSSELGQIPEDWEAISLSALCDVRDGTHDSPKYQENGIPLVTSKNIVEGVLDLSQVSLISVEDALEINKRSKVDKGDIIMSMIGTVGDAVLLTDEPLFCIKNVALFKPRRALGSYLVQVIRSQQFQKNLEDSMDGGIQKFVSLGTLRSMEIVLPSSDEQTAIATILSDMDSELTALEQKLAKSRDLKQGMMQQLLTGRIRLPVEQVE